MLKELNPQPPKWNDILFKGLWRATILSPGQPPAQPPCHPLILKSLATPLRDEEIFVIKFKNEDPYAEELNLVSLDLV